MVEFGLVEVDRAQVLDSLLERFVFVLERYGASILTSDLGCCSTTEFVYVRTHFAGYMLSCCFNVTLRHQVKVLL